MFLRDERQERRGGRDRLQQSEPEPERNGLDAPGEAPLEGVVIPESQWRAAKRRRGLAWAWVGIAIVAHAMRDPRFLATLITGVITLLAASQMGKDDFVHGVERLRVWDQRAVHDLKKERRKQHHA